MARGDVCPTSELSARSQSQMRITSHRVQQLDSIGVSWDVFSERLEEMYDLLVQFNEREGHPNVPQRHVESGENLGKWLSKQRQNQKKGTLEADRREKLDDLGIAWELQSRVAR